MASDLTPRDHRRRDDAGAVVVIVAASMGAILVLVALVLDLSGARRDREADQTAADAMALAAASSLGGGAGQACAAAWDYLVVNLPTAQERADAPDCAAFAGDCVAASPQIDSTSIGDYEITFIHPVADAEMPDGPRGDGFDGEPCDRFGVRILQTRPNLWAGGAVNLEVDAVARYVAGVGDADAALVLLSDDGCNVLRLVGTGSLVVKDSLGQPGYIAIDSDGSNASSCAGNKVIFRESGKGAVSAAQVAMWALTVGSGNAYSVGAIPTPGDPVPAAAPVGSAALDLRYDCDPDEGCPGSGPPHITDMVGDWGKPGAPLDFAPFKTWKTVYGEAGCSVPGDLVVPAGNWYINCPGGLSAGGSITFQGGDIVSDGPITTSSSGTLRVNCADGNSSDAVFSGSCSAPSPTDSTLFLRSGGLADSGNLELRETMAYVASNSAVRLSGTKSVVWTAPRSSSSRFEDLLLWAPNTELVKITGSATLDLEGVIYAPKATVELAGNAGAKALRTQIFAKSLELAGSVNMEIKPAADRVVEVGRGKVLLIR